MAKAKRVFNIAKELGISSKAIVAKCHAEGIPQDVIKNHMSTVSVGLEATVREWFCAGSEHTAVETAEKVDLEKVRTKPRKSRAKKPDVSDRNCVDSRCREDNSKVKGSNKRCHTGKYINKE